MDSVIVSSIIFILIGTVLIPTILAKNKSVGIAIICFGLASANFIQFGIIADLWPFWSVGIGYMIVGIVVVVAIGIKAIIDARSDQ